MNPHDPQKRIDCPDCSGVMELNEDNRYKHVGLFDAACPWRKVEPVNWNIVHDYKSKWKFDENGEPVKIEAPAQPISNEQFKDNVIKVDFEKKKRIE